MRDAVQATSACGRCISWMSAPREILGLMTGYSENVLVFRSKTDAWAPRAVSPAFSWWIGAGEEAHGPPPPRAAVCSFPKFKF